MRKKGKFTGTVSSVWVFTVTYFCFIFFYSSCVRYAFKLTTSVNIVNSDLFLTHFGNPVSYLVAVYVLLRYDSIRAY